MIWRRIDRALGADPDFADSGPILERNVVRYRIGLEMLAIRRPDLAPALRGLSALDDARLSPLFFDPVLRNAFEDELVGLENGSGSTGAFTYYLERVSVDDLDGTGPCERLSRPPARPWPDRGAAWVWNTLDADPVVDPAFRDRLDRLYQGTLTGPAPAAPIPATDDMLDALRRGADLLCRLLPVSGAGVLPHIAVVGFVTDERPQERMYSLAGGDPLPSAIFMAPERLADPWTTAETLLHEGLHLKLFDVLRTGSMVADPHRQVPVPWRTTDWTLVRIVSALHVYVHLLLFDAATAGEDVGESYGRPARTGQIDAPSPGSVAERDGTHLRVLDRARYLAEQAESVHLDALTGRGRAFVGWLLDAIEGIVPDFRSSWTRPPGVDSPHASSPPSGRFTRVEPVLGAPMPELGELLLMTHREPRMKWLNARAWLLYSLCEGRDLRTIEAGYRDRMDRAGADLGPASDLDVRSGLAHLVDEGLVTCRPLGG